MYLVSAIEFTDEDTEFTSDNNADAWGVFEEKYAIGPTSLAYAWESCFRTRDDAEAWARKLNNV